MKTRREVEKHLEELKKGWRAIEKSVWHSNNAFRFGLESWIATGFLDFFSALLDYLVRFSWFPNAFSWFSWFSWFFNRKLGGKIIRLWKKSHASSQQKSRKSRKSRKLLGKSRKISRESRKADAQSRNRWHFAFVWDPWISIGFLDFFPALLDYLARFSWFTYVFSWFSWFSWFSVLK